MEKDNKELMSKLREICDEDLMDISGGVLTDEDKHICWEKVRRLKVVMNLEEFLDVWPPSEKRDYMCSIWADVPPLVPGKGREDPIGD